MKKTFQLLKSRILQALWTKSWFTKTAEEQKAFLLSLPEPNNDMERSYLQYKCQCYFREPWQIFLMNCVSLPPLVIHSLQFRKRQVISEPHSDAVLLGESLNNILPQSLCGEFAQISCVAEQRKYRFLSKDDIRFLHGLRKQYPFSFFFRYECMRELALYSYLIACHRPKALISVQQGRFTASFLSAFCAARGVEHICIMHGIQSFDISISFLHFNRFYVWNDFFKDLFIELRAANDQFEIEVPLSLRFSQSISKLAPVDYTYYLQDQTPPQVQAIIGCLLRLKKAGAKIAVRPHPLHRECANPLIKSDCGFIVENPDQVLIEDSILRTKYAISLYSTALMQAYYNGKTAVIDDICAPKEFEELEKNCYMNRAMPHKTLSELLREVECDRKANQ